MKALGLIDSSALIGGLPQPVLDELERYCSSMIVRAELMYGLHSFRAAEQTARVARRETLLNALDSLAGFWRDFDRGAADGYGALTASSAPAMRAKDALIAGHAQSLDVPVVTRDTGFTRFTSVEIEILGL